MTTKKRKSNKTNDRRDAFGEAVKKIMPKYEMTSIVMFACDKTGVHIETAVNLKPDEMLCLLDLMKETSQRLTRDSVLQMTDKLAGMLRNKS